MGRTNRRKDGRVIKLTAEIPGDLHARLKAYAALAGIDSKRVVADALRAHLRDFTPSIPPRLRARDAALSPAEPPVALGLALPEATEPSAA